MELYGRVQNHKCLRSVRSSWILQYSARPKDGECYGQGKSDFFDKKAHFEIHVELLEEYSQNSRDFSVYEHCDNFLKSY